MLKIIHPLTQMVLTVRENCAKKHIRLSSALRIILKAGTFNTPVAALMELSNALGDFKQARRMRMKQICLPSASGQKFDFDAHAVCADISEELWEVLTGSRKEFWLRARDFPYRMKIWRKPMKSKFRFKSRKTALAYFGFARNSQKDWKRWLCKMKKLRIYRRQADC